MIQIDFDKMGGLIPAIIQDHASGEVLMVAFMDKKTLDLTLESGKTWFFSRTRNKYWMKGEESGNTQEVMEVLTDCDADTVVIKVKQNGPAACHTGNRSCFYVRWEMDSGWNILTPSSTLTKSIRRYESAFSAIPALTFRMLSYGVALLRLPGIPWSPWPCKKIASIRKIEIPRGRYEQYIEFRHTQGEPGKRHSRVIQQGRLADQHLVTQLLPRR
jgi:phosphoribosyl-AMP cyclohydrolase